MPTPRVLLSTITAQLLLQASSCAVVIKDAQFCSPLPGNLGAVCDNFLTSNQLILDAGEWTALQASWASLGQATECTTSQTVGDLKSELEKLCSDTSCDYPDAQKVFKGLKKIENLGKGARLTSGE